MKLYRSVRAAAGASGDRPIDWPAAGDAVRGAMDAGAAGVSMGRTVFQHEDPAATTAAVVNDGADAETAVDDSGPAGD